MQDRNRSRPGQPTGSPTRRSRKPRLLSPRLLRRTAAAAYCGLGESTWDRLVAAGKTPAPIAVGGAVAFDRLELDGWIAAGCPGRDEWQSLWDAAGGTRR